MFSQLPESSRRRQRSVWQTGTSIGVHALIITGAVWATRSDPVDVEPQVVGPVIVAPVVDDHPLDADRSHPTETGSVREAPPAPDIPVITRVPIDVPPVTTDNPPFNPADFLDRGRDGDAGVGVAVPGDSAGTSSIVITSAEADEAPMLLRPGPKVVPPGMDGITARVMLQFIIGVNGTVEPASVQVLESSNQVFDEPARQMILRSIYRPARRQGESVRVLVQQAVSFSGKE